MNKITDFKPAQSQSYMIKYYDLLRFVGIHKIILFSWHCLLFSIYENGYNTDIVEDINNMGNTQYYVITNNVLKNT